MIKGTVKFYDSTKRFGFIKEDGTEDEHFVHSSGLIDQIQENDKVEFELKEDKGLNAVNKSYLVYLLKFNQARS